MNAHVLAIVLTVSAKKPPPPPVTDASKWWAIAIGILALILLYIVTAALSKHWSPKDLVAGFDGFGSSSKLQWFCWLVVILFGYAAIWSLRALQGDYKVLSDIPVNLLTVLGFSTGTAAAAKGITSAYVQSGKMTKPGAPKGESPENTGGIFQDDGGAPDLAKIQMMGFTIIAIGIFVATVIHQIFGAKTNANLTTSLPNIDPSLMVLMGISQGGYLGKKLVTFGTPALYPASPVSGSPGTVVTLRGSNLGSPTQTQSQLLMNGELQNATSWSAGSVKFTVPVDDPDTRAPWAGLPKTVKLAVSAGGQASNPVNFTIAAPKLQSSTPQQGSPGTRVTLAGANLGPQQGNRLMLGEAVIADADIVSWSTDSIVFTVPQNNPADNAAWAAEVQVKLAVSVAGMTCTPVTFTVTPPA